MSTPASTAGRVRSKLTVSSAEGRVFTVEFSSGIEEAIASALSDLVADLGLKCPYELVEFSQDMDALDGSCDKLT